MDRRYARPQATEIPPLPSEICIKCGKRLKMIDIGLHKKMINRGSKEFMCVDCLSEYIGVSKEDLLEKAEFFRKQGYFSIFESIRPK